MGCSLSSRSSLVQYEVNWGAGSDPPASVGASLLEGDGVDALGLESCPTWQLTKNLSSATSEIVLVKTFLSCCLV